MITSAQTTAAPSSAAESGSRLIGPTRSASTAVSPGPTIAPRLPPAAIRPNSRRACVCENTSFITLQNSEMTNRLNTLTQMKNARAVHSGATPARSSTRKTSRLTMKKP